MPDRDTGMAVKRNNKSGVEISGIYATFNVF